MRSDQAGTNLGQDGIALVISLCMINIDYQLGRVQNHLEEKPLGTYMRKCL